MTGELALGFHAITLQRINEVGGKNASLGELVRSLSAAGVRVPDGFALTVEAFHRHLAGAGLDEQIYRELDEVDVNDTEALSRVARSIRERVAGAALPDDVRCALFEAYHTLTEDAIGQPADVAVRSSATAEDLPTASFAGQQETYLHVHGDEALDTAVRACMASLFTERAIVYRQEHKIPHRGVGLSVGVQKMVRSDLACAGVMFTLDPDSGFRDVVVIDGAWGLGEGVVKGRIRPDEFCVHKPTFRQGFSSIVRRQVGEKNTKFVYDESSRSVRETVVESPQREALVLNDEEVKTLTTWALAIEEHYTKLAGKPTPMDIEWAKDGRTGDLYIVQARPETVHSQRQASIEKYQLREKGEVLAAGKSVGNRIGAGPVRILQSTEDLCSFETGDVLVARMTDPDWQPVLKRAAAVVTDEGGRTCHAAIVSRELGIPCVVGTGNATKKLSTGRNVTVSCAEGDDGFVYDGMLKFDCERIDPAELPKPRVPLMLNMANPAGAFQLARLPSAGVGLLRVEFLITEWIGIHPMALIHPERVTDLDDAQEIRKRATGYDKPEELFVDRLSSGIGEIAAAFYPRPVIVRFSDFKSNEYAGLLGGKSFEPEESNPMIGFRGASRYYDERYREGFALECRAIRKVRNEFGLMNVKVMIPFCRTITEAKRVLDEMESNGLVRKASGRRPSAPGRSVGATIPSDSRQPTTDSPLEVYVMCEIPNNVILADEFSGLFDGFSIGSNDLTQLALGVDRDSSLLSQIFDERDAGVKRLISMVVETAHAHDRPVGICGEAPSNYPEFAEWLAAIGIDSMSLNADSLPVVARRLGAPRPVAQMAKH